MQLVFLDRKTLGYRDNAYISTEFELVIDMVVSQKSTFKVNKASLNAKIGDLAVLKEKDLNYIGIIESLTKNTDGTYKVQCQDFKELFNIDVPIETFTGDVCLLLRDKIKQAFINNSDSLQNLTYLDITVNASVSGTLSYGDDSLINIKDLIELISKTYGIIVKYKVGFLRGRFYAIYIIIDEISKVTKLRHDLKAIHDLKITDTDQYSVNKVIFYPKKENETHKSIVNYYLLKDGTVTTNKNDPRRYENVNCSSSYYGDSDYDSLETKARSEMVSSSNDHQITFSLSLDNHVFIPLSNMFLGYAVLFYAPLKEYSTILTQIKYKNNFDECFVTLGEYRTSLTDKIKLLSKGGGSSNRVVSAVATDVDGGEY